MCPVGARTGTRSPQPREHYSRVRARAGARSHSAHARARIGSRAAACGTVRLCDRVHGVRSYDADRADDDDEYDDDDSADDYAYIGGTRDADYDDDDGVARTDGNACTPTGFTYSFCLGAWAWSQHHSTPTNAV